jgi:membrane-associated HD superfamily phosphohydrolase
MLADTIEARVRSLDDQSPENLEHTIEEMVRKRFEEGELDECPLTLKDLTKIREAFLQVLVGVYHARVKYPRTDRQANKDAKVPRRSGKQNRGRETETRKPDEPAL